MIHDIIREDDRGPENLLILSFPIVRIDLDRRFFKRVGVSVVKFLEVLAVDDMDDALTNVWRLMKVNVT